MFRSWYSLCWSDLFFRASPLWSFQVDQTLCPWLRRIIRVRHGSCLRDSNASLLSDSLYFSEDWHSLYCSRVFILFLFLLGFCEHKAPTALLGHHARAQSRNRTSTNPNYCFITLASLYVYFWVTVCEIQTHSCYLILFYFAEDSSVNPQPDVA